MNMPNLLWSGTAAYLQSMLILQVTLGPTALFLYISKAVTRHLGMLENTTCVLKRQREKGRSVACCYQLEGSVGATCYKHVRNQGIHNHIQCGCFKLKPAICLSTTPKIFKAHL